MAYSQNTYTEVPYAGAAAPANASPTGSPNPLNASVTEGSAWTTNNTIVFNDADADSITITKTAGTIPAWVTEDLTFPHVEGDGNVTLTLGGTPPYTGAGSAGVYAWSYDVDDSINPAVTVNVNLTVNNFSTDPVAAPTNMTINVAEGSSSGATINVVDAESEDLVITVTSGSEPGFLSRDKALSPTAHPSPLAVGLTASPLAGDAAGSPYIFEYTFTDESGDTATTLVTINVTTGGGPVAKAITGNPPITRQGPLVGSRGRNRLFKV